MKGFPDSDRNSYIDLNRSGVPLVEIVSEPDLRTPEEAYDYLTRLKTMLLYLEVSNCNMEEGSLRCDANVSVRRAGASAFGTKTEVKNLNSFRFLQKALEYEIERQIEIVEGGGTIPQETRLWDSREQRTYGMRSKEFAHDYRYFPEPDLLPVVITEEWKEEVRRSLPELPEARRQRFLREYSLTDYDAAQLTSSRALADYYEAVAKSLRGAQIGRQLGAERTSLPAERGQQGDHRIAHFGQRIWLSCSAQSAREASAARWGRIFWRRCLPQAKPRARSSPSRGLEQIQDADQIAAVARQIIAANPKQTEQYRKGKTATLGWFVGQVMKATRGQANPQLVQEVLGSWLDRQVTGSGVRCQGPESSN